MLDDSSSFDLILYTVIEILKADKEDESLDFLQNSEVSIQQTEYNSWNGGTYYYTVFLAIDVRRFIDVKDRTEGVEQAMLEKFNLATRHIEGEHIVKVTLVPQAKVISAPSPNPHRPFSSAELIKRNQLTKYLEQASEDSLIEEILVPLFRQIGFHRITVAGHKDKALEYGKDIWMKYMLPTQNVLYFGIQVKKGKLDSAGMGKGSNANVAEIHNQATMMLGHEIFDPETNRRVLVDHAFIIAGGEITKAAKNWIGGQLDNSKRSQIMFMDREDILNLYIVNSLPLPAAALPPVKFDLDDLPF